MPHPAIGRRICVIGNAAAGKSTLARALAEDLNLHYICRDALAWGPDWTPTPRDRLLDILDAETQHDGWTYDGHLRRSRPYEQLVLDRCDTIIWLDFPRWLVVARVIPRTVRRVIAGERLGNGNVETWRMLFSPDWSIRWAWRQHARLRDEYAALFASPAHATKTLTRLHSRHEVHEWLRSLP